MPQRDVSAWDVISQQLPQWWADPQTKASAITRLLRDHGVDSGIYKNQFERGNKGQNWSHVIFDDSNLELPSNFADGGSVQPQMSLADYFKANVPVPMHEGEGEALRNRFPQTYGGLAGLLGTPPDEMAGSVLEPGYAERKAGADKTFALGTLLQMLPMAPATKGMPVGAIIRNTGDNNFLKGSVENALAGLKGSIREYRPPAFPDLPAPGIEEALAGQNARAASVNKFVEGPLTRYVKQQMATPDDPVRALAEQGVLHAPFEQHLSQGARYQLSGERSAAGFPPSGTATSPLAKRVEEATDQLLRRGKASHYQGADYLKDDPWLAGKAPDAPVFQAHQNLSEDMGFTHLTDELRNALNPESGLPRNLLLTPEKMANMGMEKAVRHVAAINDWRAAQVAEANAQKANNAATVLHKEYPHTPEAPNPKGLRWVELKAPETLPEGYRLEGNNMLSPKGELLGTIRPDYTDEAMGDVLHRYAREHSLTDALKYEGDTMKHCSGGYCDDVVSGRKRIFSLRDAKGEPHVTIHTEPGVASDSYLKSLPDPDHLTGGDMLVPDSSWSMYDYVHRHRKGNGDFESYANKALAEHGYELPPEKIVQIKRKANLVNSDPYEYRPFVQDFVKSGKWSDVGDLPNTGMPHKLSDFSPEVRESMKTYGIEAPGDYMTTDEVNGVLNAINKAKGFATGGRVSMIHPAAAIQPLVRVPGFDKPVALAAGGSLADYVQSGTPVPMSERDPGQKNAYELFKDHVNDLNDKAKVFNELQAKASEEFRQTKSLRGPYQDQLSSMLAESYMPGGMGLIRNQLGKWVNTTSREVALDTATKANAIEKEGVAYLQSLPADLRQALKDHGIRPVNGMLRGDSRAKAEALDQAFYNAPQLPKGTLLYRGENAAGPMADFANVHERFPYYMPTSLDIHTAKGFKKLADDEGTLNMVVPTGDTQYLLPGKFDTELEVLLPRHGVLKSAAMKAPPSVDKVLSYDAMYASGGTVALKPKQGA